MLDQLLDWTAEADLICIPGITGPNGREVGRVKTPPVLAGMEYAIIRREIQRAAAAHAEKRLDVLAYLHDPGQRQAVRAWAARRGRRALLVAGFDPEFASHLAQARILLSGFGASFYEALALRTHPVAWPYSPLHREEARRFYERLGLPLRLLAEEGQLDDLLPLLEEPFPVRAAPADGTPNLVKALAALLKAPGGSAS